MKNVHILEAEYIENDETITPPEINTKKITDFKIEQYVTRPDDVVSRIFVKISN